MSLRMGRDGKRKATPTPDQHTHHPEFGKTVAKYGPESLLGKLALMYSHPTWPGYSCPRYRRSNGAARSHLVLHSHPQGRTHPPEDVQGALEQRTYTEGPLSAERSKIADALGCCACIQGWRGCDHQGQDRLETH